MESLHWRRNLYVCLFGSFTTIAGLSLILPFLPLYVEHLGVSGHAAIVQWSGVAYGATFFGAGATAPLWGRFADRYGRKIILIRASFAMAAAIALTGLVRDVYQLVALRLLAGLLGGYASGSIVLVATQTPKSRSGWALGVLSTGILAGSLAGPLIGGALPGLIGLRQTFFAAGGAIFLTFIATATLIREEPRAKVAGPPLVGSPWRQIPDRRPVYAMLLTACMLMVANMSIEPIITVYVGQIAPPDSDVAFLSGLVMAAGALASMLAAPRVGRLTDRLGPRAVVVACLAATGVLMIPQAFVTHVWQLIALRFLMGLTLAGLLPAITTLIRHSVPDRVAGAILGYSTSAQFAGQVAGPLLGGFIGGHVGMRSVFFVTALLLFASAALNAMPRAGAGPAHAA
ncbi:MFS transporter [Nitrospirillum pindoramense]|uniref:Putative MFS family arabinose efflux permease n=1 Tax=Nitrospirillum amazonense TaxID=28077 RepID=A0A560GQP8_9PROT|nr:MFS transporter [Nitrospirillum amazonense]TWB35864.1 putative MFS family arabinose efflux permease [Nitrospirillum amazonense]